jgi:ubiquinol-cytochrome c reductase core subunit 2
MISKTTLARSAQISGRHLRQAGASQTRAFASPAVSGSYDTTEVNGVKVAARNSHGPTTKLAVVAKAGTRYQPLPGLATGLETFAFKVTTGSASREVRGTR